MTIYLVLKVVEVGDMWLSVFIDVPCKAFKDKSRAEEYAKTLPTARVVNVEMEE